jgi:hypothetical protein
MKKFIVPILAAAAALFVTAPSAEAGGYRCSTPYYSSYRSGCSSYSRVYVAPRVYTYTVSPYRYYRPARPVYYDRCYPRFGTRRIVITRGWCR